MIIWSLLIPILTCLILRFRYNRETERWEYLVVFLPSIIATILIKQIVLEIKLSDVRYKSELVNRIRHYEEWNEYVRKTCYRTVRTGKHTRRVPYDCSYVRTHPERWELRFGEKNHVDMKRGTFEKYRDLWKGKPKFIDMHRRYHTKDGDAYEYRWNGKKEHTLTYAKREVYRNWLRLDGNLWSPGKAERPENLQKYPKTENEYDQKFILGLNVNEDTQRYARWINQRVGESLRVFIVYFKEEPIDRARDLEKYWKRGKSNEVVFCVGLDQNYRKTWISSFSWTDEPVLEEYVKMESKTGRAKEILDLTYLSWASGDWKPRDMKQYSYMTVNLSTGEYAWIFWLTILVNIGLSYWVVNNEYKRS